MKNKRTLILSAIIFFVAIFLVAAVIDEGEKYYEGGISISASFPEVDTGVVYTSDWVDWTMLDGQSSLVMRYSYAVTGSRTGDSIEVILQGLLPIVGVSKDNGLQYNLDTQFITVGGTDNTLSLTAYAPYMRWRVTEWSEDDNICDSAVLKFGIYVPTLDVIPSDKDIGNY